MASTAVYKIKVGSINYKSRFASYLITLLVALVAFGFKYFVSALDFQKLLCCVESQVFFGKPPIVSLLLVINPSAEVKTVSLHLADADPPFSIAAHMNKIIFQVQKI